MTLVDDCRARWKHYSTWALSTLTTVGGAWVMVPEDLKARLPAWAGQGVAWIVFAVAVFGLGGKFVSQTPKVEDEANPPA